MLMQGCMKQSYHEELVNVDIVLGEINSWSRSDPTLNRFLESNGLSAESLQSNLFSINRLYLTSVYYDPAMQVAYKEWKKAKIVVDHSGYKINPEISLPFEHHSDTSDGQSEWTIGVVLSFIYERKSKQEARKAQADVHLLNASLEIRRLALERYGLFEEKYHAYGVRKAKNSEIRNEIKVLKDLLAQLLNKYELGAVSQFELNSVKLELQRGLFQLSVQENKLQEDEDELLAMTHLVHSELDAIEIETIHPLIFAKSAYQESELLGAGFSELQISMLANHIDMAIQLNEYAQSEAELRLEIEQQYPDLVLSPGFIFDQTDNIWALGSSWILPLFENTQQNIDILKALEERKIKQQEIIVLQKKLLNSLYRRHRSVLRHNNSIVVSDEIIKSIEQRAKEIETQIEIGGIDGLAKLRNRIEFHKARQEQIEIYKEAINAMLEAEHLLQESHADININNVVATWLEYIEENSDDEFVD
jgi:outer membrane protein, heavy metal efflux system